MELMSALIGYNSHSYRSKLPYLRVPGMGVAMSKPQGCECRVWELRMQKKRSTSALERASMKKKFKIG